MCGGLVGDVVGNEVSHMGNLFKQIGEDPVKSLEQFGLGAADPLGAKLWGGVTGQNFTPMVNQFGGETQAQYEQSKAQGVNVGPSMTLGGIADTVAGIWGGSAAGRALGGAFGGVGDAGAAGAGADSAEVDSGSVNLFSDAVPGAGGDVGATANGMAGVGADTAGIGTSAGGNSGGSFLSSLFKGGSGGGESGFGFNMGTAKNGLGAMQVLSSLYGMDQSRKLQKKATSQSLSNAGLQAVQRSMAAQGYQGSGNMMAAISKYGADAYSANLQQQQTSLANTMSSLGLLTAGVGNLAGWGSTTPAAGNKP